MELVDANPYNLEVGSVIQYVAQCGVIKWIGKLSDQEEIFAGVEMVSHGTFNAYYVRTYVAIILCILYIDV